MLVESIAVGAVLGIIYGMLNNQSHKLLLKNASDTEATFRAEFEYKIKEAMADARIARAALESRMLDQMTMFNVKKKTAEDSWKVGECRAKKAKKLKKKK